MTLALAFAAESGRANPASGLFDLLNPGVTRDLGLGGDPFRTYAEAPSSWWGDYLNAERPALDYRLEYFEPVSPRLTRGRGHLGHVGHQVRSAAALPLAGGLARGQLGLSHQDQELMVDDLGNRYLLAGEGSQGDFLLRLEDLPAGFTFQATVPLGSSSEFMVSQPLGIGLKYALEGKFVFQASQVRRRYNHDLHLSVEDDFIDSSLNLDRLTSTIDARMWLGRASWLAYSWRTNDYGAIDQLTDEFRYEIIPVGRSEVAELQLVIGRGGDFSILLGGYWLDYDLGGSAYWGGQRFAKVNYFRGEHRAGAFGFEKHFGSGTRCLFDLTVSELRGNTWGRVESWPFSDSLGDLLGGRRTFRGGFSADWTRWHLGLDRGIGEGGLKAGFVWYDIFPEARVQHWDSSLGFPIGGKSHYVLDTDRLQLGAVSLGGTVPLGGWRLDLEVFQFIHGNIEHLEQAPDGGDGGEPPEPAEPSQTVGGWIGGTYARLELQFVF